jgi:hypothetical protein
METAAVEIRYSGELDVRPYRRGTYFGPRLLEEVIQRALGPRYSFGVGWRGEAEVLIRLFDARERARTPPDRSGVESEFGESVAAGRDHEARR